MVEKTVQCPKCGKIITSSGKLGEVVKVNCPSCGNEGKVTFQNIAEQGISAIEVSVGDGYHRPFRSRMTPSFSSSATS